MNASHGEKGGGEDLAFLLSERSVTLEELLAVFGTTVNGIRKSCECAFYNNPPINLMNCQKKSSYTKQI